MKMKKLTFNRMNNKAEKGLTLMEMLAYLVIAIMIIVGSVAMWKTVSASSKEKTAMSQVMAIQTSYRGYYSSQTDYGTGDMTEIGVSSGIFPTDLKISGSAGAHTVKNGWSGVVTITASGSGATFDISFSGIPKESCNKIAVLKSDWLAVSVNGTALTLPVTPATAMAACTATTNTLVYTSN